jgi:uncharacterized membrane protein
MMSKTYSVNHSILIARTPDEVYGVWRNLNNLTHIFSYVRRVDVLDDFRSHWVVEGPAGVDIEWNAEITEDVPGQRISWRTLQGSTVQSTGTVNFTEAPQIKGTLLQVGLIYHPPAGALGQAVAAVLGTDPKDKIIADLERFKTAIEAGPTFGLTGRSAQAGQSL